METTVNTVQPELLRLSYSEQGEWARHYNAARMTVSAIMLPAGLLAMGLGIEFKQDLLLVGAVLLFGVMGVLVVLLTRLIYKHIGHQVAVESAVPALAGGNTRAVGGLRKRGVDPSSGLAIVVVGALGLLAIFARYSAAPPDSRGNNGQPATLPAGTICPECGQLVAGRQAHRARGEGDCVF